VEHFSRYGVPMDEDDDGGGEDDQDGAEAAAAAAAAAAASGGKAGRRLGAPAAGGDSDLDEATVDEGSLGPGGLEGEADEDMAPEEEGPEDFGLGSATGGDGRGRGGAALYAAAAPPSARKRSVPARGGWGGGDEDGDDGAGAGGGPLQHSLPALLALQPGNFAAMRESFFREGGATAADVASAEAASMAVALPSGARGPGGRVAAQEAAAAALRRRGRGAPAAAHNWARPRPALLRAAAVAAAGAAGDGAEVPASTALALVARPSSPSRLRALAAAGGPLVPVPAAAGGGNVCDAFMLLGRSFRAGFGPGGQLAVPVNASAPAGGAAPSVRLSRAQALARVRAADAPPQPVDAAPPRGGGGGARAAAALAGLRRRTLAALEAHLSMARRLTPEEEAEEAGDAAPSGAPAGAAPAAPRWRLECGRRQVGRLVEEQLAAVGRDADAEDRGHAADTWRLVRVLFEHIEGEGGPDGDDASIADAMSVGGGDDASVLGAGGAARLAAFKRRAALSRWLAAKAAPAAAAAIAEASAAGGRGVLPGALLHLVASHQLGPAAALAAAAGDARLAVLLATAGRHASGGADLAKQLQAWHAAGLWRDHFSQPRKLLLAVLSGRIGEAAAALGLDWPRALGLALW
jgi:hypothetical protein